MLVFHYRCHGNGSHIFGPKIIKNVMKNHLFCIIVSSRVKIVGLWVYFLSLTTVQCEYFRGKIKRFYFSPIPQLFLRSGWGNEILKFVIFHHFNHTLPQAAGILTYLSISTTKHYT